MITEPARKEFESRFTFLQHCAPEFIDDFYRQARFIELPTHAPICEQGMQCTDLALVIEGVGRVFKLSPSGREITLYRIQPGQSCVLTASCIMSQDQFPAMAYTETQVRALLIPQSLVRSWFCQEPGWQTFVFGLLSHRLWEIVTVIEEVAFKRIDVRIAEQLQRHARDGVPSVTKTHAELAADVGSSREVISRVLKDFSDRGLVKLKRGKIELLNMSAIEELSRQ